jgi:thiamine biosynthesis lipoprotein
MGTVVSIDVRDPGEWDEPVCDAVAWLHRVDAVFSTYRAASDISRMQRGDLTLSEADPAVAEMLGLCAEVRATTGGFFTERFAGRLDPTGLVKGWAIERAGRLLHACGARNFAVNGGGDMQLAGEAAYGRSWSVGISDPHRRDQVCAVVTGRDIAVATSGAAERGAHIVDPTSGRPARKLASATVIGPSLALADGYATAAYAMGTVAVDWIDTVDGYEALLVDKSGTQLQSSGWQGFSR